MFSQRSGLPRDENALARALRERRAGGQEILDLTSGNPTRVGLDYPESRLRQLYAERAAFDYQPAALGLESARGAAARLWASRGVRAESAQIAITASTSEAYSHAFRLLCDPGDEVLVPAPSYPLFEYLTHFDGVRAVPYRLAYDLHWHIDWESVQQALSPRTRAILVVNPNNPTGNYLSSEDAQQLETLGVSVICDEVFNEYPLAPRPESSLLKLVQDRPADAWRERLVIVLDGLSKRCAMPQLKLAWMTFAGDPRVAIEALARLELIADTYLSASTVAQSILPDLLAAGEGPRVQLLERIRTNLIAARQLSANSPVTVQVPQGGWYAVLRLPALMDEERWALELLGTGVLVQPGYFYDFEQQPLVVISLIGDPSRFTTALRRLTDLVSERAR